MQRNNHTIEEIKDKIDEFSEFGDFRGAYEYYKDLEIAIKEANIKQAQPEIYKQYNKLLMKLKFLSLNFFDKRGEMEELLKHHFELVYEIKYYDLWNKIETNLLTIPDLKKRDEIKSDLKKSLLDCNSTIINKQKYKDIKDLPLTVADWLKDYNAYLETGKMDKLKRIKYLTNSENIIKLNEKDKSKIKTLVHIYEKLRLSSQTSEGFEGIVPIVIEGKFYTFSYGNLEPINEAAIKTRQVIGPPKTEEEKKIEEYSAIEARLKTDSLEKKVVQEEGIKGERQIEDLKILANKYNLGSLERKAIEEEIEKLRKSK